MQSIYNTNDLTVLYPRFIDTLTNKQCHTKPHKVNSTERLVFKVFEHPNFSVSWVEEKGEVA